MTSSIKQLKLVTGEELICEVLDEAPDSLAIRNAFTLTEQSSSDGYKYFSFRAFMIYQDTPLQVILIMCDKIMGMAIPTDAMIEQYEIAKNEMFEYTTGMKEEPIRENNVQSIEDYLKECEELSLLDSDVNGMTLN